MPRVASGFPSEPLPGERDLRFPKRFRLLRPAHFRRVFDCRCISGGPLFTGYAATNDLGIARIGLVVSRKVSPLAVVRNRIKRRIRECFRHHRETLTGLDIVVVARSAARDVSAKEFNITLVKQLKTLGRKCRHS